MGFFIAMLIWVDYNDPCSWSPPWKGMKQIETADSRDHRLGAFHMGIWILVDIWKFPDIGLPLDHPFKGDFSIINQLFLGIPMYGDPQMSSVQPRSSTNPIYSGNMIQ